MLHPSPPLKPPTPSPVTTPPGSPAPAATEIPLRHRPLAFVAFVGGKPLTARRFGEPPPAPRSAWRMYRCPVGNAAELLLSLSQWNREGPRARSRKRVLGKKRASPLRRVMNSRTVLLGWCQSTPSRWLRGAAAVVAGSEGGEHFGEHLSRRSAAMHAHRYRLGPRQSHATGSGNQWRQPGRLRPTTHVNRQLGRAGHRWLPNGYATDSIRGQPLIPHRASTKC
jgi:hypothetical protein